MNSYAVSHEVSHIKSVKGYMFMSSQNSFVEALTPNEMVRGGGAFGIPLDLDEVIRAEPP